MQLDIVSWNSTTDINNGTTFNAWYEQRQQFVPTRSAIYAERPERWQKLSGASLDTHNFTFKVQCLGTIHSQRDTVKGWFDSEDFTPRNLVLADNSSTGGGTQWYLQGIPVKVFEETPGIVVVTLATDEPYLRAVTSSTDELLVTANGDSTSVTVDGNMSARPIITITPTSAKTGDFGYARWVSIYNPGDKAFTNYPLDVGGVDTAALVSGGKMVASGIDYVLEVDGNIADSWFGTSDGRGINTTDTAMWGIFDYAPRTELTLKVALTTDTAAPTVYFNYSSAADRDALIRAKNAANKVFLIDSEAFTYESTGFIYNQIQAYCQTKQRAAKGTTIAAHSVNATVRFLEHDVWQLYDSTDYTATSTDYYTVDDNNKPMFDLHSSNTSWIYSTFRQGGVPRPGAWIPQIVNNGEGNLCKVYTGYHTANANPATYAGMKIAAFLTTAWKGDTGNVSWQLNNPGGITTVQASLERYLKSLTGSLWPAVAGLEYLDPTTFQWETAQNITIPTVANTWQSSTIDSTDGGLLATTAYNIRYKFAGSVYGSANNYGALEVSGCTIGLSSTGIPQVTVGAEQSKYLLTARITNTTTGEWIRIRAVVALNDTITIDCDKKTVTGSDGTNLRAGLTLSSPRADWLNFEPGSNTIRYNEVAAAGVTLGMSWEARNTL